MAVAVAGAGATSRRPERHRPSAVVNPPEAEDHAGFGGINPERRGDAGDLPEQDGRRVAELLTDAVGNNDLVRGYIPSSAATSSQEMTSLRSPWRMRSTRARHSVSCSAEGTGGSIGPGAGSFILAGYCSTKPPIETPVQTCRSIRRPAVTSPVLVAPALLCFLASGARLRRRTPVASVHLRVGEYKWPKYRINATTDWEESGLAHHELTPGVLASILVDNSVRISESAQRRSIFVC
jgi:hypothetical protein